MTLYETQNSFSNVLFLLLLFILTANGYLPGGSGTTIRHNTQITHIKQNNTTIKRNTAYNKHPTQNEYNQSQLQLYKNYKMMISFCEANENALEAVVAYFKVTESYLKRQKETSKHKRPMNKPFSLSIPVQTYYLHTVEYVSQRPMKKELY
jgi:hypothetical protein